MFLRLALLFVLVPLVEFYLLYRIANLTSFTTTVLLVLGSGCLGAWLAKRQGMQTLQRLQQELSAGRLPTIALADGAMILVAGVLLLTPGILTDLLALSLLCPPCRAVYRRWLLRNGRWQFQYEIHQNGRRYRGGATREQRDGDVDDPSVVDGTASPIDESVPPSLMS